MKDIKDYLNEVDLGKLFLRLAVGLVFINAGWGKIGNIDQVISMFASLGLASWIAYLVAYLEFFGGLAVLLGIATRYSAGILVVIMLVATFKVHLPNGYSLQNGGYEYTLALMFASLAILYLGAGTYALSSLCHQCKWCKMCHRN